MLIVVHVEISIKDLFKPDQNPHDF